MIIWFNLKITDQRMNNWPRYNLRTPNRFDTTKYAIASYAALEPLVSMFMFNMEMADEHAGRENEMAEWINSLIPANKVRMQWFRCNHISQWRDIRNEISIIDDDLIYPAGSEDHIFMDSNLKVISKGLEILNQDEDPFAALVTSHFPESIRNVAHYGQLHESSNDYAYYYRYDNDSIRIMKKSQFSWYVDQVNDDRLIFRTEAWHSFARPYNKMLTPTKELFRHFDGYSHVYPAVDCEAPPLEIPPNFFTGMTIRYGFDDRDPNSVNINPTKLFYINDTSNGTDYKFLLEDIPIFWKPFIKEIVVAPNINDKLMKIARNQHYFDMTQIKIDWTTEQTKKVPLEWVVHHFINL